MFAFAQRWTEDWARLDLTGDADWRDRLLASHAGPGRHYHTLQYLAERPGEARPAIYGTPELHARLEVQARAKLRHAIAGCTPDS